MRPEVEDSIVFFEPYLYQYYLLFNKFVMFYFIRYRFLFAAQ